MSPIKPEDRAAYMREYRAKRRTKLEATAAEWKAECLAWRGGRMCQHCEAVTELEEEVRKLKAELAKRPTMLLDAIANAPGPDSKGGFGVFRPVPKPGKGK